MIVSSFLNMEFRNVVFNAARDGKLRRLKVGLVKLKKNFKRTSNDN
jgi:hypothetical protein